MSMNKFLTVAAVVNTGAALTDSSGGTASATLAAISGTYVQAEVRNSIASLAAQIEATRVDLAALTALLNAAN
jgi:hypothetical protein